MSPDSNSSSRQSQVDYRKRREERQAQLRRESTNKVPYYIVGGIALVLLAVVSLELGLNAGKIHYGVTVSGLDLSGKKPSEAVAFLDKSFAAQAKTPIAIQFEDTSWDISAEELGLTYSTAAIVEDAMSLGRSGSLFQQVGERISTTFSGKQVPIQSNVDEAKSSKLFDKITKVINKEPKDATVSYTDGTYVAADGADGRSLNAVKLAQELSIALIQHKPAMEAPVDIVPMAVTLAEAQEAASTSSKLISAPIALKYKSDTWPLDSDQLAQTIVFIRSDELKDSDQAANTAVTPKPAADGQGGDGAPVLSDNVSLIPVVSSTKIAEIVIPKLGTTVGKPPVNARFTTSGGEVKVIPGATGTGADPGQLAADILATMESEVQPKIVEVNTQSVEPEITTEKAKSMGIKERISTYSTSFASGNKPRVDNIQTLARCLDGKLVAPGETFSFNGAVGERTAEKGFKEAGAIVDGELVQQLGGGICQVNTTLFNAVLKSGLKIAQRRNHSYYISHYPLGRDATVSWGGPDFKFVNTLDTWILVSSSYTNTSVTISLYGTDPGYSVFLKTSDWSRVKDFSTKEVKDPELKEGTKVIESSGVKGGRVVLSRTVKKGGTIVLEDTFTSNYSPKVEVVRVGTKKPKTLADTAPVKTPQTPLDTQPVTTQ